MAKKRRPRPFSKPAIPKGLPRRSSMPSDNVNFTKEKKIGTKSQQYPKGFPGGPPCPVIKSQQYPKGFPGGPPCPAFKSQQYPKGFSGGPPCPAFKSQQYPKGFPGGPRFAFGYRISKTQKRQNPEVTHISRK